MAVLNHLALAVSDARRLLEGSARLPLTILQPSGAHRIGAQVSRRAAPRSGREQATFLAINDFELEAPETETLSMIYGLADGSISEEDVASWIRSHLIPWVGRLTVRNNLRASSLQSPLAPVPPDRASLLRLVDTDVPGLQID